MNNKWIIIGALCCLPVRALSEVSEGAKIAHVTSAGALMVDGSAVTQPVSGSLTIAPSTAPTKVDIDLTSNTVTVGNFPVSYPVSGTFWQSIQPVSGSMSVSNFPASQAVTGSFYQSVQPVSQSGTWTPSCSIDGSSNTVKILGTLPVSGTFYQATQPVSLASMPSTPVTGTFWQATQPVSLASMPSTPVTGTFWQATQAVSIASMPSTPVTGTFWQATQPISGTIQQQPATLVVSSASAVAVQLSTGPLAVSGQFHYITFIEITAYSTVARTGGTTPVTCTTSNLPGGLAFTFDTAAAVGSSQSRTYTFPSPLKSVASNTNTLVTCPGTASIIWRLNLFYYAAT